MTDMVLLLVEAQERRKDTVIPATPVAPITPVTSWMLVRMEAQARRVATITLNLAM
jgi:hypothetical protein